MNITDERKTKLQAIIRYWNENLVSDEAEYNEDTAAATLLSLMIDREYDRIRKGEDHER